MKISGCSLIFCCDFPVEGSLDIQRQMIADYREGIRKYAEGLDQGRILNVSNQIPSHRSKSLRTLIGSERYSDIRRGIKLTGGNIGYSDNIYTFPYFCAFLLKRYLKENGA